MSILDRYIDETETELDKSVIQNIIREIYQRLVNWSDVYYYS